MTVRRYNETADDPVPVTTPPTARQKAKLMEKIAKLARSGLTYQQIADALGIRRKKHVQQLVCKYNSTAEHPIKVLTEYEAKINDEVKNGIIREHKNGASFTAIGKQFNISYTTVGNVLRKEGLILPPLPTHLAKQKRLDILEKIIELARSDLTYQQIADAIGLRRRYVYQLIFKYNQTAEHPVKVRWEDQLKVSDDVKNGIIIARENGTITSEIAKQFGVPVATVNTVLKRAGLFCQRESRPPVGDKVKRGIIRERKKGATFPEIATRFEVSHSTIKRVLTKAGLIRQVESRPRIGNKVVSGIIRKHKKGATFSEIAKQFEFSRSTVKRVLTKAGLILPRSTDIEPLDDFVRKFWNKDDRAVDMLLNPKDFSSEEAVKLVNEALLYAYERFQR